MSAPGYNPNRIETTVSEKNRDQRYRRLLSRITEFAEGKKLTGDKPKVIVKVNDYDIGNVTPEVVYTVYVRGADNKESVYAIVTSLHHLAQLQSELLQSKLPESVVKDHAAFPDLKLRAREDLFIIKGKGADECLERDEIYRHAKLRDEVKKMVEPTHRTLQ